MCTPQLLARSGFGRQAASGATPGTVPAAELTGYRLGGSQWVPGTIPLTPVRGSGSIAPPSAPSGPGGVGITPASKRQGTLITRTKGAVRRPTFLGGA